MRIRKEPSGDAAIYDLLEEGAKYEVVDEEQIRFSEDQEITADWVAVNYGGKTGYVSSEYVQVDFEIDYGETVEQVKAREEAETARLQAEKEAAAQKQKKEKAAQAEKEANKAAALAADDSVLLAALIQCEAGEEPYEGQVAVGAVVMNRVRSGAYPNTVKGVIYASGQFTPAGSGQVGRVVASGKIKASCLQAAQEAMAGSTPVGIATHFRRAGSREGIVIGHHVFHKSQERRSYMTEVFAWLALLILLVLIELATMGLTTIWFAAGALVATIAAACGAPVLVQVILFLVVSVLMLVFTRPVALRYFNVGRAKTNVDSVLGERGIVTGRIDNLHSCGQVTLKGMEWSARSQETEGTIEEGTVVIVKKIDGVKLIVVPDEIETEEPVTNSRETADNMR